MKEPEQEKMLLRVTRAIPAPRERVFAAWTSPEEIKMWFGPETCRVVDAQVDLRVGGEYCFYISTPRLGEVSVRGQYREVTPPSKLVYTWRWEGNPAFEFGSSLVSVEFIEAGGSTTIRLTHEQLPSAESRDDHAQGWIGALDKLESYLVS
jgi:uncharacterized protein YndB with AHSA1/START domain